MARWRLVCVLVLATASCDNPFVGPDDTWPPDGPGPWADAYPNEGECNLLLNTGCAAGRKCTWVRVSVSPPLGQVSCAPDGTVSTGGACEYGAAGVVTGFDNCMGGNICDADPEQEQAQGTCREVCSLADGSAPCASDFACQSHYRFFSNSDNDTPAAGLCDPTCDPLSGVRDSDSAAACGGPLDANDPDALGCYGVPSNDASPTAFTCMDNGEGGHRTVLSPPYFVNSCASGSIPLLYESSGSMAVVCISTCEPRDCNATIRNQAGGAGCWRGVAPYRTTDRGCSEPGEECKYLWWFEGAETPISAASDDVGFCVDYTKYRWDRDQDPATPDEPWTACRNALDTDDINNIDADFFWGCVSTAAIPPGLAPRLPRAADRGISLRALEP